MIKFENVTLICNDAARLGGGAKDSLGYVANSSEFSFRMNRERADDYEVIYVNVTPSEAKAFAEAILADVAAYEAIDADNDF